MIFVGFNYLPMGVVQKKAKKTSFCEEPFDRLRINSATKQSADSGTIMGDCFIPQ